MTKTTLMTLLRDRRTPRSGIESLYVIRDDDVVFYVGKSTWGGAYRILEHWAGGFRSNDRLHEFMRCAIDDELDLTVELLSIPDCQSITQCVNDLDEAESALIALHCPVFNTAGNDEPIAEVPKKYEQYWAMINQRRERIRKIANLLSVQ
jgi:hypothetical protein